MKTLALLASLALGTVPLITSAHALPATPGASAPGDMSLQVTHKKHKKTHKKSKSMDQNDQGSDGSSGAGKGM
jgi:hypothetical protein